MLVDVHAHLMLEGHEGQLYSLADMFKGSPGERLSQFVEYFRRAGIDRVILCSDPDIFIPKNDGGDPAGSLKRANDTVAEACARYPDLFAGSVMVNPLALDASLREIETRIETQGFVGVGEICQYRTGHGTDTEGMREILRAAARLDVPVNIHSSLPVHTHELATLMRAVPEATVIMAHIGGSNNWRNGIKLAEEFPELYVDLSGITVQYAGTFEAALARINHERMLFGVDFPLIQPESMTGPFFAARMPEASRKAIACENALRIYKRLAPIEAHFAM